MSNQAKQHSVRDMIEQLALLGVRPGDNLLVHTSFRAIRPIEDGPAGLIQALIASVGPSGTVVMPSWTGNDDAVFEATTTASSTDLGVVADVFWRMPGVRRSDHPFAFAAYGRNAAKVVKDSHMPAASPICQPGWSVARTGGSNSPSVC